MRGQKRVEDARERADDPRIHLRGKKFVRSSIDCRVKPGNDGVNLWTMGSTPATTIALTPPLIVSESQIGEIFEKVGRVIRAVA